jgi:ribosomal protein S18 acetylase RimI-like enzyme
MLGSSAATRLATPADLDAIAPLFDAYRGFYKQESDINAGREFLRERLEHDQSVILVAEVDGVIGGFVQLYPSFSSVRLGTEWILNDLFVAPEHRRLGLGRLLVQASMAHARETGALSLELLTEVDNSSAQSLYESLGWKRTTEFYRYTIQAGVTKGL